MTWRGTVKNGVVVLETGNALPEGTHVMVMPAEHSAAKQPTEAAGPKAAANRDLHHDLDALAGTWSEADAEAFEAGVAGSARVDPELWK